MERSSGTNALSDGPGGISGLPWRRWLTWTFLAGAGLWILLTLAAWLFVKYRRDFPEVKYVDLLWPGRWPQYRVDQGNHYIAQSETLLQQGEYALAVQKLRIGVSKAPANAAGRTLLARVYLAYRRPDLAREVLIDGLAYLPDNAAYLQSTLSFLLEFQEDAKLLELTHRMLAAPANPATASLLATFAATAAFYRGNYDEAEDLLARYRLDDTADGALLQARIAWELDYPELALVHLKEHLAVHSQHDAARALLAGSTRAYPEWTSQFAPVLNGLQAVALSGLGRTDEAASRSTISSRRGISGLTTSWPSPAGYPTWAPASWRCQRWPAPPRWTRSTRPRWPT